MPFRRTPAHLLALALLPAAAALALLPGRALG
jgi:hypothetical protein